MERAAKPSRTSSLILPGCCRPMNPWTRCSATLRTSRCGPSPRATQPVSRSSSTTGDHGGGVGPAGTAVDDHQYSPDAGPCLESLRTGEIRRSPSLADDTRWPKFRGPTLDEGVVSCLSLPLMIGNHGTGGVLNLYSQSRPFEEADEVIGRRFMPPASVAVANARAYARSPGRHRAAAGGPPSRDVIGQAKGIIQARERCSPDEAFERLRDLSQHRNVKPARPCQSRGGHSRYPRRVMPEDEEGLAQLSEILVFRHPRRHRPGRRRSRRTSLVNATGSANSTARG